MARFTKNMRASELAPGDYAELPEVGVAMVIERTGDELLVEVIETGEEVRARPGDEMVAVIIV